MKEKMNLFYKHELKNKIKIFGHNQSKTST